MNGRLRSVIGFALACVLVAASVPALALPNGTELMTSGHATYSSGLGTTSDTYFNVRAYKGQVGGTLSAIGDELRCDGTGTFVLITDETIRESYRFEIKAASDLGSFVLTDITMGEVNTPGADFSGVTVEGYQGTTLVCSTASYNSGNGVSENKFPIDFTPFAGVRIDSFRINYVKEKNTYASTFNLASFTVGEASTSSPAASDTRLQSGTVKGQAVSSLGTAAATPQAATAGSVTITRAQSADSTGASSYITQFAPAAAGAAVKVVKYASGAPFTNFATDPAYVNQAVSSGDRFVVRVTSQDAAIVRYYVINVTVMAEALAAASVSIPAPAAGGTPAVVADVTGGANFAVTGLNWNGTMTAGGKFKAGTSYTANLTLTANAGYTFPANFTNVTAGSFPVGSFSVNGTSSGNSVTCSVTFPATAVLTVTAIEITGQPKLSYKDGNALDLSGMVIKETFNDGSQGTVNFTGGTAVNYTANPSNGSALSRTQHDSQPVLITYTGVTPNLTAQTNTLTVVPLGTVATLLNASVKGVQVTDLGMPGASPDEAVPGSVTIMKAQSVDESGIAPYLTAFVPTDEYASVKAVKYVYGASHANFASDAAYSGQAVSNGDCFVIRVTAEDEATVNWYAVDVTVMLEEITSVNLAVTAPAAGAAPENVADIPGSIGYTVTGLTWNGEMTASGCFKAGTAYTADLTVTAKAGYTFPEDFSSVSVPSDASVGDVAVLGTGEGNGLTLTAYFASTDVLAVTAIEVTTQPRLAYKEGNTLDLTGMAVRRIYNDWTEDIVTFTDGTAADFSSDPAHGAVLSHDDHDGWQVTLTYAGVTPNLTAQTDELAVAALSSNASLAAAVIKGRAAAGLGTPGASPDAALPGSVILTRIQGADVTGETPYGTWFTPADAFASVKAVKYASGASYGSFATDPAYAGQAVSDGDRFVIRVTAENGTSVSWYQIEATVLLEQIASASVTIPVPTAGGTPANAADTAGGEGFIVTGLTWNGTMTGDAKFKAGTAYTASLTLTSSAGYTFPTGFSNVAIDASSVSSYQVTGTGSGNRVTCQVVFPATSALTVTAIQVTGQPRLSYKHGNALDLSGMVVTQTYNDFTQAAMTFAGGTASNYTAEPVNGAVLSHILNDGQPVTVTYTGVTPNLTAQTENLQVAPLGTVTALSAAAVKGVAVASLGTPGASPDTALPGSVTLSRAQGADVTGTTPYLTWFTPTDGFASVKAVKYAAGASYANFASDAAYAGQAVSDGDRFVIRVTAEDGATLCFYALDATVLLEEINSVSVTVTAPAAGAAPQSSADIQGGVSYTVTGLAWNETLTPGGKFKAGIAYTATLTLMSKPGYTFPAGFADVTATGASSVFSCFVNGTDSGNSASCVVSFPVTEALHVTAIEVTGQPKLSYKDGYTLDLSGMAVRQTYNDFTQDTVTFTDGTAADYTADPSNGFALSRAEHDGLPVTVTYTGVTPYLTAQTDELTVAALSTDASLAGAVIKGQSATGFVMASSPEAAAETAVMLSYISAEDATNLGPYATTFTASDAFASVKAVKYASGASFTNFSMDAPYAGQKVSNGDRFVVRVTAEDGVTVRYCVFAVTIQYSELSAVTVSIMPPTPGGSPQSVVEIAGGVGFAVTGLDWSGTMTAGGKFKAGTAYTCSLTLTADPGYTFPAGFTGVTVSGASSVDTYAVTGMGSGNGASCIVAFPETAALTTALLAVDTQPTKLEYREGEALDLSGLKIKKTYNDGTEDTVVFTDGTAAGFELSLANGIVLTCAIHNGYGVKITETATGCFVYTAALSVLPPLVPDSQLQETTTSGMTVMAEGSFSDGAQLVVTPIEEVDTGYEELSGYLDGRQALSAFEVSIMPEGFYEMPVTLTFSVDSAYNGYTLYIFHRLVGGSAEMFTPTVQNGMAMITVTSLSPFLLAVDPAVEITAQPQDTTVYVGQSASFTVAAQGVMPLTYQWQNRLSSTQSWHDIPLATDASHLTGAANLSHDGSQYRVMIIDGLGRSVYSEAAMLTVRQRSIPDTGDHSQPVLYVLMTVFLAAGAALLLKKRRRA